MKDFLKNNNLIDYKGLLIVRYKELNITEQNVMILLVMIMLDNQGVKTITPQMISQYMYLQTGIIEKSLVELVGGGYLSLKGNHLALNGLYDMLLAKELVKKEDKQRLNLVEIIENEFGRTLSPIEMETIREWDQLGYGEEMILNAVKEATLRDIHSLRYIATILQNWREQGITNSKKRTVAPEPKRKVDMYDWLNEE